MSCRDGALDRALATRNILGREVDAHVTADMHREVPSILKKKKATRTGVESDAGATTAGEFFFLDDKTTTT